MNTPNMELNRESAFWALKCSRCKTVVPNYKAWPLLHDMDGGVWELAKPKLRIERGIVCVSVTA